MQTIVDILKITVALAVLVGIGRYYVIHGLPPRGRGRWRGV